MTGLISGFVEAVIGTKERKHKKVHFLKKLS